MGAAFGQCLGIDHGLPPSDYRPPGSTATAMEGDDDERAPRTLQYTAHPNWAWVVHDAVRDIVGSGEETPPRWCKRQSELPSQAVASAAHNREKPVYALFKVEAEVTTTDGRTVAAAVWASSQCLGFLDAKDALYRELKRAGKASLMPDTVLIPWDAASVDAIADFPTTPALLKSALGSGGFGLYFVTEKQHALAIMQAHATRARQFSGFLDGLKRDHDGAVPSWSIQAVVNTLRVGEQQQQQKQQSQSQPQPQPQPQRQRRCQVRAYVALCEHGDRVGVYLLRDLEVRLPSWAVDLDATLAATPTASPEEPADRAMASRRLLEDFASGQTLSVEEFEEACCAGGAGRPYNLDRNKAETERVMLHEVPELAGAHEVVLAAVRDAMMALQPAIVARRTRDALTKEGHAVANRTQMAIAGVDLLVEREQPDSGAFRAYLVEINNNPALPQEHRKKSAHYQVHLVRMVANMLRLGLAYSEGIANEDLERLRFERVF